MTVTEAKEKLLNTARAELGYKEGNNNYIKYAEGKWDNQFFGWELQNQPWCDLFVDYCFTHAFGMELGAAMTYQKVGHGSALCRTSAQYYKNNGAYFNYPEVGDQIFFYYDGNINHTGIVETIQGEGANWRSLITIEGNSDNQVRRNTYYKGNPILAGYGRPKWSLVADINDEPAPTPTPSTKPITSYPLLKYGMYNSADVKLMQSNLIKLGYDLGRWGADGDFGNDTLKAVKKFQSDHGLLVDGEVGDETWAAMDKALNPPAPAPTPIPTPTPVQNSNTIQKGSIVKIKPGSYYYNSKVKVPDFVINDKWVVLSIRGDRVVVNDNVSKTRHIMSPVNISDLILEK